MKKLLVVLLLGFLAPAAAAQVTVGVMPGTLNSSDANFPTPQTNVSLENPATGAGTITNVTFAWSGPCTAVAKIKFFRRSGNSLTMLAERGPFDSDSSGITRVTLSPAVPVQAGDLIAITRVLADCHTMRAEFQTGNPGYVVLQGDATSGTVSPGNNVYADRLGLVGTGPAGEVVAGFLPVVGSTAGGSGSNFKTSAQLFNPSNITSLSGRLIYHRAGASGTSGDPSLAYSVPPGAIVSYADVVVTMGQTGLGSIDVVPAAGTETPMILLRIYNDAGANGTAGFFLDLVGTSVGTGSRILSAGTQGFLLTPIEPARTRMNIGVRSLAGGATMTVRLEDSAGLLLSSRTKTYLANWFEQVDSATFLGAAIGANQKVRITMTAGSAIVYGATTDNVTNDPSVQLATALPIP